ncbi:ethylene-responsive transcription factor 4-like [Capsicum chacoense]
MLHHMWPPQLHQSSQTFPPLTVVLFASPTTLSSLLLVKILLKKQKSRKGSTRVENVNGGVAKAATKAVKVNGGVAKEKDKVKGFVVEVHYRGVRKRPSGKCTTTTRDPRKICNVLLGTFDTVEEAMQAYDMMAIEFHGVKVKMNFLNLMEKMNRSPSQVSIVESPNMVAVVAIQPSPPPLPPPQPPP